MTRCFHKVEKELSSVGESVIQVPWSYPTLKISHTIEYMWMVSLRRSHHLWNSMRCRAWGLRNVYQERKISTSTCGVAGSRIMSGHFALHIQVLRADDFQRDPDLVAQFEATWIGEWRERRLRRARCPLSNETKKPAVLKDLPHSISSLEGWHRAFASSVRVHPTLTKPSISEQRRQAKLLWCSHWRDAWNTSRRSRFNYSFLSR